MMLANHSTKNWNIKQEYSWNPKDTTIYQQGMSIKWSELQTTGWTFPVVKQAKTLAALQVGWRMTFVKRFGFCLRSINRPKNKCHLWDCYVVGLSLSPYQTLPRFIQFTELANFRHAHIGDVIVPVPA